MNTSVQRADSFTIAAQLLVAIAGPEPVHIEMSARGPKKYYEVHRRFDERDARAHLAGDRTKGATLRYPEGQTRALCYDADISEDWQCLQEAAHNLASYGYQPLLEASPVGRGGHLWIIFTELVRVEAVQCHLLTLAPALKQISEYWPRSMYKVRLPAGEYVKPGFASWCTLADAHGTLLATDGPQAASVLLAYQTPFELIPEVTRKQHESGPGAERANKPDRQKTHMQARDTVDMGQVDTHWQQQHSSNALWFRFTPRQLAALYNEGHPLSETLHLEPGGMAFSPSVQERTPSTAITSDGQAWVDFSARSLQPDGKHDGGDALELAARRNGESKAAKSNTLREAARMLVREARDALEAAARAGEEPPTWVAQIMTDAGWQRYHSLSAESTTAQTTSRGVTGFLPPGLTTHAGQEQIATTIACPLVITEATSSTSDQGQDPLEVLAATINAQIGEPCSQCGCTLYYQSELYRMCHLCYPCPAKFGRLTDEQWQQVRSLFPRNPEPSDLFKMNK
jgi:hypothetical protein